MSDNYMDSMGSGHYSDYTLEEIKKAEKLMKKFGGTLVENLEKVTGKPATPRMFDPSEIAMDFGTDINTIHSITEDLAARSGAASSTADALGKQLAENQVLLDRQIRELNENLAKDFGVGPAAGSAASTGTSAEAAAPVLSGEDALNCFNGLADVIGEKIFGQEEFIKKLVIAFKRPYVMTPEGKMARNTLFITGNADTGKHLALTEIVKELNSRRLLSSAEIRTVNLGQYPEASMESIFLQDMYSALASKSDVILFENFENCHPSFLNHISSLVTDGSFALPGRYVMQKGQLVNVQNSLAADAVGELNAKGKYLVFITEKSLDKAAGILGAPFVDALKGDICRTSVLDEAAIRRIAEKEMDKLRNRAASQYFFEIDFDDRFLDYSVSRSEKQAGVKGVQAFYDSVSQALAQARLEGDFAKGAKLFVGVEDGRISALCDNGKIDLSAYLPDSYRGEIDEIRKEMDEIVGLTEIKKYVLGLEEFYRVQKRREEEGLKTGEVSKHMIFTGSPGTGKTTIARIISKYLKAIGILTGGQLVEVSRADLVGRYVGHTAPLTNQVIKSAIGGVLFIDEAYSLYRGKDDSYGLEAIDTLVKGIEDNRDNLIVILAGYSKEMQEFLTSNSGLKSRFPNVINFPDYTGEELLKISRSIAKSKGYTIDSGADDTLTIYFNGVQMTRAADAGNGRLARNLVEEAILNQSRRLAAEPDAELSVLLLSDFDLTDGETPVPADTAPAEEIYGS